MQSTTTLLAAEYSLISRFFAGFQSASDIPLRLTLWNGLHHDLRPAPQVTVNLAGPGSFPTHSESLEEAQSAKLDHILKKIMIEPGERLLDIGCGWGALVIRAAQKFGAQAVGVTLSKNQYALACERVAQAGLTESQSDGIHTLVDETTYRVWRIDLAGCAHAFSQNWVSLYQILACKAGTSERLNPTPWSRAYIYA